MDGLDVDLLAGVAAVAVAAVGLVWRIVVWRSRKVEERIASVDEKVEKVDDKLGELIKAVYELKGEVKGRAYAEADRALRQAREDG